MTIIKSQGDYIFGGYTSKLWKEQHQSNSPFVSDPTAYIFSLVNKHETPVRMNTINGTNAISQNPEAGPIFGLGFDIYIGDTANGTFCGSSYVGCSYQLPDIFCHGESLAESKSFKVKEIEVFQII